MKMSCQIRSSQPVAALLAVVLAIFSAGAAQAQVILLTIDDSTPGATIITATASGPTASTDPRYIADGIDLVNFFTANTGAFADFTVATSSLTTGDGSTGPTFTEVNSDDITTAPANADLNLFHNDIPDKISFTMGQPAFLGTLTLDLTGQSLPAIGTTGSIVNGFSLTSNTAIGEWEIVSPVSAPEPSTWMLVLGSMVLLPWLRRNRQA